MRAGLINITKLVRKYSDRMMLSSAKQSPGIKSIHGGLHQSIQLEQSGFNAETNLKGKHSLRVGWRNFFSGCAVVSVFGSGGKKVLILHTTYVLRVQYSCGVVLVFWFWWEIVFGVMYVLSVQNSCAVVSVFWLWRKIVFLKKKLIGLLYYDPLADVCIS